MNAVYEKLIGVINTPLTTQNAVDAIGEELNAFVLAYPKDPDNQELTKLYKFVAIFILNNINQRIAMLKTILT